jgi:hypothetical protein
MAAKPLRRPLLTDSSMRARPTPRRCICGLKKKKKKRIVMIHTPFIYIKKKYKDIEKKTPLREQD